LKDHRYVRGLIRGFCPTNFRKLLLEENVGGFDLLFRTIYWGTCNSHAGDGFCKKISLEVDCCSDSFYRASQLNPETLHSIFHSWDQYLREKIKILCRKHILKNNTLGDNNSPVSFSTDMQ